MAKEGMACFASWNNSAASINLVFGTKDRESMEDHANLSRAALLGQTRLGELIGESRSTQRLRQLIEQVSQQSYPVLILGESGTGKELVARCIHSLGPRAQKPFTPVDCAALVPTLIESELFGYVKGAFTGATLTKQGLFEVANEGTLFLDEIGDLAADLQAKLLRVMQEKEIRPVGSTARIPINLRVIAATNRDLEAALRSGTFRQDLYFRLNVVQINLLPLRARKSDIPLLVNHFLKKSLDPQPPMPTITEDAMQRLMTYDWPGNIRELENAIERAVALSSDSVLDVDDFPPNLQYAAVRGLPGSNQLMPLAELKRRAIFRALQEAGGDKLGAARLLGIGKTTIYRKLKQYARSPAQIRYRPESKEVARVQHFLICTNPRCRFLVSLREGGQELVRSQIVLDECPECGHEWSDCCPFCGQPLEIIWREESAYCSHCARALRGEDS